MEKTKFLCHWAEEGFVGTKEQQDILRGHLIKAEKLLFEANCFVARLYEMIPENLASRVCGQPVWLPSTLKWLKEKFKAENEKRRAENPPKPKVKKTKPPAAAPTVDPPK
jgi:hypothetical protein